MNRIANLEIYSIEIQSDDNPFTDDVQHFFKGSDLKEFEKTILGNDAKTSSLFKRVLSYGNKTYLFSDTGFGKIYLLPLFKKTRNGISKELFSKILSSDVESFIKKYINKIRPLIQETFPDFCDVYPNSEILAYDHFDVIVNLVPTLDHATLNDIYKDIKIPRAYISNNHISDSVWLIYGAYKDKQNGAYLYIPKLFTSKDINNDEKYNNIISRIYNKTLGELEDEISTHLFYDDSLEREVYPPYNINEDSPILYSDDTCLRIFLNNNSKR